jgi:YHS domain-containing protein
MTVDVARAEADGMTTEHDGRTYAFCRAGCLRAFNEAPDEYAAKAEAETSRVASVVGAVPLPVIDEGMRRWYENCSCCLSDAYPEIKAALDAERASGAASPVAAGICEVAEGIGAHGTEPDRIAAREVAVGRYGGRPRS